MTQQLSGKVALVTGGNSGIGLAIANRFIAEGASVIITGRRQPELDAAVEQLGPNASAIRADVSQLTDIDTLYAEIKAKYGHLDILIANAGGGEMAPLGAITEEHFDRAFNVNVKGTVFTVQKALPLLAEGASVILVASTVSVLGGPGLSIYSATKAAVRNLARSWIQDLKGKNIRINVVSPGPIKTPGLVGLVPPEHEQALLDTLAAQIPMGRVGEPDEIAKVTVFLASDAASFVNGVELFADGGQAQV
ncbi:oxidoreductase [Burkholderia sp. WAC0059]|uniref:SDR family NAD(P)-dependent oxidoreductase n=1 Tax=Burkholderia sp. WAC0059 TaxID=2066022 RepID=UPI000C7F1169|nr:glucose 1-dehydrogenase [Burkholderia sp. WAC0059]PLZ00724.1 oxidoreductase [Burkholderia sp. WAC0059]